jgi:uncharacterized membrane protein YfcA
MEYVIYFIGGFLAGLATGLVGLSAATIIAPLFATVLKMDPYLAIGIALISDVFASSISAFIYYKNKNISLKRSYLLALIIISFTILGSYISVQANPYTLNSTLNIFLIVLGLRFIIYPVTNKHANLEIKHPRLTLFYIFFFGIIIGLINGYYGAGGGLSILAVLTMLLKYPLKEAIGTSVFIMMFTAFFGGMTHIALEGTFMLPLIITVVSAFLGANIASIYANKINIKKLNITIGSLLASLGIVLVLVFYL